MQTTWQIQEAKSRFSELIGLSLSQGPQTITRHGRAVAQIVAIDGNAASPQKSEVASDDNEAFGRHLLNAPSAEVVLDLPQRRNRKLPPSLGG